MAINRTTVMFAGASAVLLLAAFLLGRSVGSSQPAGADRDTPDVSDLINTTPVPGATPDTREIGWHLPYAQYWGSLPRYDRTVAGIAVGPSVEMGGFECSPDRPPSLLEVEPSYLPPRTEPDHVDTVDICVPGTNITVERRYWVPPIEEDMRRLDRGEIGFFEARGSASFRIFKRFIDEPAWSSSYASEYFREGEINGYPAAIGEPLFPEGWGQFEVIVYQPETRVLTVISGVGLSTTELLRIAEGAVAMES